MTAPTTPALSIVIPAYNEERRLGATLDAIQGWKMQHPGLETEVVVSIEKSSDRTVEIAEAAASRHRGLRVLALGRQAGKGHAVRQGMLAATGEVVFFMDADLSTSLRHLDQFLERFAENPETDILVGNRADPEAEITQRQSRSRELAGKQFNRLVRLLGLTEFSDTQCGFKAFRHHVIAPIFERQQIDGFAFDVEVLALARAMGLRIESVPVEWHNSPESKVNLLTDLAATLRDLLVIRHRVRVTLRRHPIRPDELVAEPGPQTARREAC